MELIPQALEMAEHAAESGKRSQARAVEAAVDDILARPEHAWFRQGAEGEMAKIREQMEKRYGQKGP